MTALEKLLQKNEEGKFICVGLDTDLKRIPAHLKNYSDPVFEFNKAIIKKTYKHAAAYKLNFAFYESNGDVGFRTLEKTIAFIPKEILTIGDAKRGDIGNTSQMYAHAIFNQFKCDASTINPLMGEDSVLPFLEDPAKLNFILALTSNPGANDFEKLKLKDGSYLFQKIIDKVKAWNKKNNCGIVFGATKIEELQENIDRFGKLPVLLPGVGAQGGSLEGVVKLFKEKKRIGFIINVSRSIIYKSEKNDFAFASEKEIIVLNKIIKGI